MKTKTSKEEELAAIEVLRQTGIGVLEAALVAREALRVSQGRVKRAVECIAMGAEARRAQKNTVTFERAVLERWRNAKTGGRGHWWISAISAYA